MGMMKFNTDNGISTDAQYLYRMGLLLSSQGKKEEALNYFRRAVTIAPRFCKALDAMGTCLDELGRYNEALREFDRVIKIDPHHAEARLKRQLIRNKMKE
jgi:superkiller protein 3